MDGSSQHCTGVRDQIPPKETEIEEGTLVTRAYIKLLEDNLNSFDFKADKENKNAALKEFLEILKEECDRQDAE